MKRRIAAVLTSTLVALGLAAAPASAHWPDWWAAYNKTQAQTSYPYYTSSTYGAHSRAFIYRKYAGSGWCDRHMKIGDDYYIWDAFTLCYS